MFVYTWGSCVYKARLDDMMNEPAVKILIIEPEAVQRYGLSVALSKADRTIFEVSNPAEGLEILKKNEIDVVFTEIRFPAEDGGQSRRLQAFRH